MSANKLLNRIVIPENVDYDRETNAIASDLHDYTYGMLLEVSPVAETVCT